MRVILIVGTALLLAACASSNDVSRSCVRGETGGEFTSNVDGEGNLYYACTSPPASCTFSTRDMHGGPLYVCPGG